MIGTVVTRILLLKKQGIAAMKFGDTDKTDFLIPRVCTILFLPGLRSDLRLPTVSTKGIFHSEITEWVGVAFCFAGLASLLWTLVSFGKSFRVGIDITPTR